MKLEPPDEEEEAELRGYFAREAGTPRTKNAFAGMMSAPYHTKKRLTDAWTRGWDFADKWINREARCGAIEQYIRGLSAATGAPVGRHAADQKAATIHRTYLNRVSKALMTLSTRHKLENLSSANDSGSSASFSRTTGVKRVADGAGGTAEWPWNMGKPGGSFDELVISAKTFVSIAEQFSSYVQLRGYKLAASVENDAAFIYTVGAAHDFLTLQNSVGWKMQMPCVLPLLARDLLIEHAPQVVPAMKQKYGLDFSADIASFDPLSDQTDDLKCGALTWAADCKHQKIDPSRINYKKALFGLLTMEEMPLLWQMDRLLCEGQGNQYMYAPSTDDSILHVARPGKKDGVPVRATAPKLVKSVLALAECDLQKVDPPPHIRNLLSLFNSPI